MHLLFAFSNEEIIKAISWTLLHSLWQGILLSLIAGCIMLFTKRANPLLRYNLLTATLAVFIIGVAATFVSQIVNTTQAVEVSTLTVSQLNTVEPSASHLIFEPEVSVIDKLVDFLNANAVWVVLAWLLIIGYKFIRLGFGLYNMHQLKRRQVSYPGEYWNNKVTELCRQLQVNKVVQLLQSHIIRIPAVIGYLKPVILFPAAMLTAMPLHEVEAVLIHELGHIRRRDFLINMLQNIVEVIFFFNPSILWVSSLIKTERENCCDDIAVTHTANKQDYIKALITFQQYVQPATQKLVTAFSGDKNHLLNRVRRIIYNNNKTLNNMEKKFLSASIILVSVCLLAFASNKMQDKGKENKANLQAIPAMGNEKITSSVSLATDTLPDKEIRNEKGFNGKTYTTINGKKYIITIKNNQVTELNIDDQKIPAEKIGEYKTITDQILKQMKIEMAKSEKAMAESEIEMAKSEKAMAESEIEMAKSEKAMAESEIEMAKSEKAMAESEIEMAKSEKAMAESEIEMAKSEKAMAEAEKEMAKSAKAMEQAEKEMAKSEKAMAESEKEMAKSEKAMEQSRILQEKIIENFISENIIKNKKELYSYKLSADELIVNGIKQPEAIHKKFKDKYVKNNSWMIIYEPGGVLKK